ncbi:MAG: VRR-NUC domain-containing protein [Proteiniphilum sp.]
MRHIEDSLQQACVTWFDLQFPHLSRLLHHSPNGGKRNAREAARFKAMGTRAGFPDLVFLYPAHGHHALLIEMKTTRSGSRQTANQKEYQRIVEKYGYKYIVCRTFFEFQKVIINYLTKDSK